MDWWEDELCERPSAGSRYVVRYDNRDTGRSVSYPPGKPEYSLTDLASDAIGVLDTLGLRTAAAKVSPSRMSSEMVCRQPPPRCPQAGRTAGRWRWRCPSRARGRPSPRSGRRCLPARHRTGRRWCGRARGASAPRLGVRPWPPGRLRRGLSSQPGRAAPRLGTRPRTSSLRRSCVVERRDHLVQQWQDLVELGARVHEGSLRQWASWSDASSAASRSRPCWMSRVSSSSHVRSGP